MDAMSLADEPEDDGPDKPFDASNPTDVKRRKVVLKAKENQRDGALRAIMSLPSGRKLMWDELEACHVFSTSFDRDAIVMAFREGERNRGLFWLAHIQRVAPQEYLTMIEEASKDG